ncbi:MAG: DUF6789 family protein [Abditibacteriaceae bacterium]
MEHTNTAQPLRAIGAGFVATVVMTMLMYMAPRMGMPNMDIAAMLGSVMNGGQMPAVMSGPWLVGIMMHFVMGTFLFSLIYAYLVYGLLPGQPWVKGLIWGIVLWAVMQAMVLPMMGKGFFASKTPAPLLFVMGTLMGHLLYGIILGALAGTQLQRSPSPSPATT